jgi:hypothetical protein
MPRFCGACGFVGHCHLECGTGEHDEDKLKWGEFLKADWSTWKGQNPGGNRGGVRLGRGGRTAADWESGHGRGINTSGRGNQVSWRYNALVQAEEKAQEEGDLYTGKSLVKKN